MSSPYKKKFTIWEKNEEGKLVKVGITRFPSYGEYLYHLTHTKVVNGERRNVKPIPAVRVEDANGKVTYKPKEYTRHGAV